MPLEMRYMYWNFIWLLLYTGPGLAASNVSLNITPSGPIAPRVGSFLNITCFVLDNDELVGKYKLEWIPPNATLSRVNFTRYPNALTLQIDHVLDGDSGVYFCNAFTEEQDVPELVANVTVLKVLPKKGSCSPGFFICKNGDCIIQRFLCDGRRDCPDGSDEIESNCGLDPCKGKVQCEDRCIPNEVCCFHPYDGPCPFHQPDCCKDYFIGGKAYGQLHIQENLHRGLLDDPHRGILEDRHQRYESDMGFLQSTIYTIIGCAVAFIFIVTIMVVAVCRVHMKQAAMSPHPRALVTRSSLYWAQRSSQDLTGYAGDQGPGHVQRLTYPPSTNLLVTYNINNGVQLVGRLVEPPPYSEIVEDAPITDGPPPPYSSAESLNSAGGSTGIHTDTSQSCSPNQERHSNHALLRPTMANRSGDSDLIM